MNSDSLKVQAVPTPMMTLVVLLLLKCDVTSCKGIDEQDCDYDKWNIYVVISAADRGRRDRMVVGFITTYAVSTYRY